MVVVTPEFQEQRLAQEVIMSLEVPERVLLESEASNPGMDWMDVLYALDRVFLSHGGAMGQYRFLGEQSALLDGRTPAEVLPLPDGPSKFCRAASVFADQVL